MVNYSFNRRVYGHLPNPSARVLYAYLSELASQIRIEDLGEWTFCSQRELARLCRCTPRTVQRYERALEDLGIIEVRRGHKRNRRKVRVREVREWPEISKVLATAKLREWRHACRDSDDTRVATVDNLAGGAESDARAVGSESLRREALRPTGPRAARDGSGKPGSAGPRKLIDPRTTKTLSDVLAKLNIGRRWWPELHEITTARVQLQPQNDTREFIEWAGNALASDTQDDRRGKRFLALMRTSLAKLEERSAPRTRALARL